MKLSAAIMTYNESMKIGQCLDSLKDICDEIVVLDSYSTDNTVEIAKSYGAVVHFHEFLGYIEQRKMSVSLTQHELVLALDADEFLSHDLAQEILNLKENGTADAYYLNRYSAINGRFLRHTSWFPHRIIRLFRKGQVSFTGNPPHDRVICKTKNTSVLSGLLMHHCNEDIHDRMVTVNNHSTAAALHRHSLGKKTNYFRILIKPIWKFIVEYFLRLGFLDGFYGLVVAKTTAYYIYLRESKLLEYNKYTTQKK